VTPQTKNPIESAIVESQPNPAGWRLEHTYAQLPPEFFTHVAPTPVTAPKLVILNRPLAQHLGLDPDTLALPENAGWFTGNTLPPTASPIAQAYAGHQFGNFTNLGDGRAILLGEQITPRGERFDIQLKGPGRTRYSRGGDGRAALGPMLREYIISEAMHAFGIPTTRSLAVAATGERVYRETILPGAILTRVAASHIRVGTMEFANAAFEDIDHLRALADYTIRRHYPELDAAEQKYAAFFRAVLERQAQLIARWQNVGFIHGVMNTDNMALSGETIDYGPCAFMDAYDPATVFSSIDRNGRYAYHNQPSIAAWNLSRLGSAMLPLFHAEEEPAIAVANGILETFAEHFDKHWLAGMRAKLGLFNEEPDDIQLAHKLLAVMHAQEMDFTNTFRDLSGDLLTTNTRTDNADFTAWHTLWTDRLRRQPESLDEARALMRRTNPAYIPRNHKVEQALTAATEGDLTAAEKLLDVITHPFSYERTLEAYSQPAPASSCPYQTFCGT
jgi:serine/tyrosine/threonine adenylyltransferase